MGEPAISIIIPVGPRHAAYLPDALASVMVQRVTSWEALVINDTGSTLHLPAMPGVRVLPGPTQAEGATGPARAARARNEGLRHACAPWVTFLDADDALTDEALAALLRGAAKHPDAGYIYGAWWNLPPDGTPRYAPAPPYDRSRLLGGNLHPITALVPTEQARQIGGFDPRWDVYEDWEFWLRLGLSGCCGQPVPEPVVVYRNGAGSNRDASHGRREMLAQMRAERFGAVLRGEVAAVGCCGSGAKQLAAANAALQAAGLTLGAAPVTGDEAMADGERVRLEWAGEDGFSGSFKNPFGGSGERYRVSPGNGRFISAHRLDVDWLIERGFQRVKRPAAPPPLTPLVDGPPAIQAVQGDDLDVVAEGTEAESVAPRKRGRKAE
jgi:hypothetical protein